MLHRAVTGAPPIAAVVPAGRVVLVHGFTQTLRSWDPVYQGLPQGREIVAVDLPGHGGSSPLGMDFVTTAAAVGQAGGRGAYSGYSMGGRLCLQLGLDRPDLVTALVLTGASPGLADPAARAARRRADEILADEIEAEGTAVFIDQWLRQPLFAGLHPTPDDVAARRANPADGLASALRTLGTGAQEPLWARLGELTMPVLVVVGEGDAKFRAIGEEMVASMKQAAMATISGAGHAAHLERPAAWAQAVTAFLDRHQAW